MEKFRFCPSDSVKTIVRLVNVETVLYGLRMGTLTPFLVSTGARLVFDTHRQVSHSETNPQFVNANTKQSTVVIERMVLFNSKLQYVCYRTHRPTQKPSKFWVVAIDATYDSIPRTWESFAQRNRHNGVILSYRQCESSHCQCKNQARNRIGICQPSRLVPWSRQCSSFCAWSTAD